MDLILGEVEQLEKEQKWPEALVAARRAEALTAGGADSATQERARQVLHALQFVSRLEELRVRESYGATRGVYLDEGRFSKLIDEGRPHLYAAAFRDFGVDVETLPADEAAARLRARPEVAVALAAALDDWARAGRRRDDDQSKRLWALTTAVDPDPWRVRVRQAVAEMDVESLIQLANAPDTARQPPQSQLLLAGSLQRHGRLEQALALLERACEIHPGDFSIHFHLAWLNNNVRPARLEAAVRHSMLARALRPLSAATWSNLGLYLLELRKLDEAIACFKKAIELDPSIAAYAWNGIGNALKQQKKLDEAIRHYRKAIELDPTFAGAQSNLGGALRDQKKLDEAIAAFRKAIELEPKLAPAFHGLGNALMDQKKWDEALAAYLIAIDVDLKPNCSAYLVNGNALRGQGRPDEAITIYRKLIEVDPKYTDAYIQLGGTFEHQKKRPDEAIAVYRQGLERLADNVGLHVELAHVLWRQRRLEEAADSFRQAIKHTPRANVNHYHALGCVLIEHKKPREAVDVLRKAVEIKVTRTQIGGYVPAHHQLGLALSALGEDADAIASFRQAIELEPLYAEAYAGLGNALRSQGKLDDAIAALRQAVTLEKKMTPASPRLGQFQWSLADVLNDRAWQLVTDADAKSRDPKRAVDLVQEAEALAPNLAWRYRKTLGVAHYRAGNWKAAVETLEKSRQQPHYRNDSVILFFLSMAYGRLDEKEQACKFYDQAAQWRMGIGATEEELRRSCTEAAALLGLEVPPTLKELPVLTPGPTLVKPAAGATLDNGTAGGSKPGVWEFDWSDVPGATQYHLYVIGPRAWIPVINNPSLTSSSFQSQFGGIADQNRLGWRWKVRALVKGVWTDWSEERTFDVAPLAENKPASPKK